MPSDNPRRKPVHADVSEAMIKTVVHTFYARIRADEILGPIFDRVIGDNWDAHLAKMCDFWSSVMMLSGRYKGNPMLAHMRLKMVRPEHFDRWLRLFGETVDAVCPPGVAAIFRARASNIASSFQLGMFYRTQPEASAAASIRSVS
jgi:hemoglobin